MTVALTERDGMLVASVTGPLDASTADEVAGALEGAVSNRAPGLVLDLSETTHVDSAGVHLIFDIVKRLDRRQQELHIVAAPDSLVADIVAATDLASYAGIAADVDGAVAGLRSGADRRHPCR